MRLISILGALFFASVAEAQLPQAPSVPQAPMPMKEMPPARKPVEEFPKALAKIKEAERLGKPLVVFIGVEGAEIPGAETFNTTSFLGDDTPRVFISAGNRRFEAVPESTPGEIQSRIRLMQGVSRQATPFARVFRRGEDRAQRDDDSAAAGRWPASLPRFPGMQRYRSARYTQAIYTLNDAPAIDPVDRGLLKPEWQVPGGMEGVHGWKSDLYRYIPDGWQRQWQQRKPVKNSFGTTQFELGFHRAYPDGTYFVDALSHDGRPFEVRVREKNDGVWTSYIAWKDVSARPPGYAGLTKRCAECHNQAGSGEYGVGLVPGADTVISDPFDGLER